MSAAADGEKEPHGGGIEQGPFSSAPVLAIGQPEGMEA